jgi:hypothetical protein
MPIARPRKKGAQRTFETEWTGDRVQENSEINRIRERVDAWRTGGYVGVTTVTRRLLEYWSDPSREKKLFFCQREAAETVVYLAEVAARYGDAWIENYLRDRNGEYNAGLPRIAMKMATGSGKTVVMGMLIAWQALNKLENRQDARFSDAFLVVSPGITIRDRLRVLLPTDPDNYYRQRDVLPPDMLERLAQARIVITNYHGFLLRERGEAARLTKSILGKGDTSAFRETPDQMVRRIARELSGRKHIVVMVFDRIAGFETGNRHADGAPLVAPGRLAAFNNEQDGRWTSRPNSILVDSQQLESGEGMSADFKAIAAAEIEEFKLEYRARFPGRDLDDLTDEDLLREVMNTVGKPGKLGEHVRCVVSVSMLTEGWDANTVTHILGVRAFGTQLLCEQVVGRGLRRMSYAVNDAGRFMPEYAEVYGVPFSFIPTAGAAGPVELSRSTRVRAIEERAALEITFPRLAGYRHDFATERLDARFDDDARLAISTAEVPTWTQAAPIVGESSIHTLDDLRQRRPSEVAFLLAKLTIEKYFRQDGEGRPERPAEHRFDAEVKWWVFPQVLAITKRWLAECLTCKDETFPQLLLLVELAHDAADRIYRSIVASVEGAASLKPILRPFDAVGSTRWVDFDTAKPVFETAPDKCHVSHVVADTGSWEQKLAQTLESMAGYASAG